MASQTLLGELRSFMHFAAQQIDQGQGGQSVEALLERWRRNSEYEEAVADVRQGMIDDEQGRGQSVEETFAAIRQRLGIPE